MNQKYYKIKLKSYFFKNEKLNFIQKLNELDNLIKKLNLEIEGKKALIREIANISYQTNRSLNEQILKFYNILF